MHYLKRPLNCLLTFQDLVTINPEKGKNLYLKCVYASHLPIELCLALTRRVNSPSLGAWKIKFCCCYCLLWKCKTNKNQGNKFCKHPPPRFSLAKTKFWSGINLACFNGYCSVPHAHSDAQHGGTA